MKDFSFSRNAAVSPVVGVMLMLVVTIVIAALVSAFSGGLMQTDQKAPQVSIQATYSQMHGLTMTHLGGDSLETQDLQVLIRPSDELGRGQSEYGQILVNESTISDVKGNYWLNANDGTFGVMSWSAGETMYVRGSDINNSGISNDYPPCYREYTVTNLPGGGHSCYVTSLNNQINIGKTISVEIVKKNGKMIASASMPIEP